VAFFQAQDAAAAPPEPAEPPAAPEPARPPATPETPPAPQAAPVPQTAPPPANGLPAPTALKGAAKRTVENMEDSLHVPTATSVREVPMKLLIDQREQINTHLAATTGGKVSFTHLIAYAMVLAIKAVPEMNHTYALLDGKPYVNAENPINLGIAIDVTKSDGSRQLLVPNIKNCQALDFASFWKAYEEVVKKSRQGELTVDDFAGTTVTITNPGGIGTSHSVPRLMPGQGVILGVGSIEYPPEYQGASRARLHELGVSKVTTLTSTYDHRIIQGAQSGEFLKYLHQLLIGEHGFFDAVFASLRVPYTPIKWALDDEGDSDTALPRSARMISLIHAYRSQGHLLADIDPLQYRQRAHPSLAMEAHGLTLWDLDRSFAVGTFAGKPVGKASMRDILKALRSSYCRTIGVEYMHITDAAQRTWVQERFEAPRLPWAREEYLRILDRLSEAELFETFLQTKYVGQKRFSLEGGESAIIFLAEVCAQAANAGLEEVVIGMPHRGRLNVLANIVGKSYAQIFKEFEGNYDPELDQGSGDVKYHLGSEGVFTSLKGNPIKTSLAANPSHLEAVDPVLEGIVRAKLDALDAPGYPVVPVLVHGDAAFAGQGVVYETMQLAQLEGYKTGGTIHLVINNQVGFTTSPAEGRSSVYCTDLAKTWQCPIFHVNGDDPAAVAEVGQLAFDFRQQFGKDVVIDMVCYRRRGHNEGDDPSFTQPAMYDLIERKHSVRDLFTRALVGRGDITAADAAANASNFRSRLETVLAEVKAEPAAIVDRLKAPEYPPKHGNSGGTAVSPEVLERIAQAQISFPVGFTVHPKVLTQLQRRAEGLRHGPIDWATAELAAIGSLLLEGRPVRLAGQDTRRGTFSQRFAAVVDRVNGNSYLPLAGLADAAPFYAYDSPLSEYAALGFEYGYSVANPDALVLWEAQFGDFANGAQTIADEFISDGKAKWNQTSGVVLLLPHGHEGQGPDHSSARIERWLNLCSEGALAVCQPSTPASYFHLLRQHAFVDWHRPMVVATPKSMLRSKLAVSQPGDFTSGRWRAALPDPSISDPARVRRILLCSGKVRWELVQARTLAGLDGQVAIIPLERLYPLPTEDLAAELAKYPQVDDIRYVQEEPENQGAWWFMQLYLPAALTENSAGREFSLVGITRPPASAPSVGSLRLHNAQQADLISRALAV
jgi:2-oxoglutarate dehydrogenase E1 component